MTLLFSHNKDYLAGGEIPRQKGANSEQQETFFPVVLQGQGQAEIPVNGAARRAAHGAF